MKQVLAIFALLVAASQSANCPAYTATFSTAITSAADGASALATNPVVGCANTAYAEGNAPTAQCQVACYAGTVVAATGDATTIVYAPYNYNDFTYGNLLVGTLTTTKPVVAGTYAQYGSTGTCTTTTTFAQVDCQGASSFYSVIAVKIAAAGGTGTGAALGFTTDQSTNVGFMKAALDCAFLATFDASWCRLAHNTHITILNGVALISSVGVAPDSSASAECGADSADADMRVQYSFRVNAAVMSAAAVNTRAIAMDLTGAGAVGTLWTAMKAAITTLYDNSVSTSNAVGTEQFDGTQGAITWTTNEIGTLYSATTTGWKNIDSSTTAASNPLNSCDATGKGWVVNVRACDSSAINSVANANVGTGKGYCSGSTTQAGCQHGCADGYIPYGADADSGAVKTTVFGEDSYTTSGSTTVAGIQALAAGTGGHSSCSATGTFTAGTCERSFKFTIAITVGTNVITNDADYAASTNKKRRQVECAFMNILKSGCCVAANGAGSIADATLKSCKGVAVTSAVSSSVITFTANVANVVTSEHAVRTALGTAATVKTNLVAAINAVETAASHYTLTGIVVGDVTTVGAVTQGMCYLDQQTWDLTGVTLQSNSSAGCGVALAPGATCTPVCGTGYSAASGTVSCSSSAVLTGYNCSVAPTPTPTASNTSCTYGATSTCATRVTQAVTISSLTASSYTGNLKSTYECGYAKSVTSTWCTATSGTVTYLSGVQVTSSAARRAATITFVMDVETTVMTASAVQTAVASGVTASALVSQMTAINTATGWSVTVPAEADITVATAAFAGAASGAGALVPSALAALAGVASLLMM